MNFQSERFPLVMGILNITPDSFSDGGSYIDIDAAIAKAKAMVNDGADILDVGGESSRPGAEPVPDGVELERIAPVIRALKSELSIPISVDSVKPYVMRKSLRLGVDIINDINALRADGAVAAAEGATVCLMHMQGTPETMQDGPSYSNVVEEVLDFLTNRVDVCLAAGFRREEIWIDPGFGFGKTVEQNYALLKHLSVFKALGHKLLVGMSRKSMLGAATGRDIKNRKAAGIAATVLALQNGADIIRTHDVAETQDAIKVWRACELGEMR